MDILDILSAFVVACIGLIVIALGMGLGLAYDYLSLRMKKSMLSKDLVVYMVK